jgi:hypothetical protein
VDTLAPSARRWLADSLLYGLSAAFAAVTADAADITLQRTWGRTAVWAYGVATMTAGLVGLGLTLPFAVWDFGAFVEDAILFPLDAGDGESAAETPTVGSSLLDLFPSQQVTITVVLCPSSSGSRSSARLRAGWLDVPGVCAGGRRVPGRIRSRTGCASGVPRVSAQPDRVGGRFPTGTRERRPGRDGDSPSEPRSRRVAHMCACQRCITAYARQGRHRSALSRTSLGSDGRPNAWRLLRTPRSPARNASGSWSARIAT